MGDFQSNSSRLAKNTIVLYIRTLVIMVIGLYTSRVLLQALGIDNYGIYNVIGGFVGMFSVISGTLVATTQRYLNVEIGKGEKGDTKKIFGVIFGIHLGLALVMVLLFETVGLWFLNYKLNIPPVRMYAANWVYQLSVLSAVLSLFSTPYIGVIVSYERMKAFAFISLQDAILKLIICYLLYIIPYDKLIVYATMFWIIVMWDQCIYVIYCRKNFKDARVSLVREKALYRSIFGFAGLNFIGSFSYILSTQGVNVILNLFFGVGVNAARAIAVQVQGAMGRFSSDFMTALNPQITKEYAAGDKLKSRQLSFRGSKFGFFITLVLAIPVIVYCKVIMYYWLHDYPDYTVAFVRLTLLSFLISVISQPLVTLLLASGHLKKTTWWIGGTRLMVLPLVYVCFKVWNSPIFAYVVVISMDTVLMFVRMRILETVTGMSILSVFLRTVLPHILSVTIVASLVAVILRLPFGDSFISIVVYSILCVLITSGIILLIGFNMNERSYVLNMVRNKVSKFIK